uniref:Uncharacterized protein n=1 Tax=Quercus lobata TaxID=97700 RepID=A0A7N2L693_QUELO
MLSASASLPPICAISSLGPPAFANRTLHWIAVTNDKKSVCFGVPFGGRGLPPNSAAGTSREDGPHAIMVGDDL